MTVNLREWFEAAGGRLHPSINIVKQNYDERGYRLQKNCTDDVSQPEEQEVVSLPFSICFSILHGLDIAPWWPSSWIEKHNTTILTRFLLVESYLRGDKSRFHAYIRCLPQPTIERPFNTPLYWTGDEKATLQGTNLIEAALKRQDQWEKEFAEAKQLLLDSCSERRDDIEQYTFRLYQWSATVITSRCFPGNLLIPLSIFEDRPQVNEDDCASTDIFRQVISKQPSSSFPVLLPVLDLANHSPSAHVTWKPTTDAVQFVAELPHEAGAEVYNNYGQKSNEELILGYGFDLAENAANQVSLALPVNDSVKLKFLLSLKEESNGESEWSATGPAVGLSVLRTGPGIYALRKYIHPLSSPAATPLSIVAMNTRNLFSCSETPGKIPSVAEERFPSRISVVCLVQFFAKLRQQYYQIDANTAQLPVGKAVEDSSAFQMGVRYRNNQLDILTRGINKCMKTVHGWQKTGRLLSLHVILTTFLSAASLKEFRQVIHRILGTRNVEKIQSRGQEEFVFVLWIIWVRNSIDGSNVESNDETQAPGSVSTEQMKAWLTKLEKGYGKPGTSSSELYRKAATLCWTGNDQTSLEDAAFKYEDVIRQSGHTQIGTLDVGNSKSSKQSANIGISEILRWAVRVVREEKILIPPEASGLSETSDQEVAEFVLVFEDADDELG